MTELPEEIKNRLTTAFEKGNAEVSEITTRRCSSDRFDGVEYNIYGHYVPTRTVIDTIAEMDGLAIEHMAFIDEGEPRLNVFVAYLPVQDHPAFI